ncbi:MAG: hypothetical protein QME94_15935, partial [Anaerolineae bacterium]|nr:hypothetical protein [Anaerolineae bacterium]
MNHRLMIPILLGLATALCSAACADSWIVHELAPWEEPSEGGPRAIIFTLTNDTLSLNTTGISTGGGGSSTRVWELLFSGRWAAFGAVDPSGSLVPDPYAAFLY